MEDVQPKRSLFSAMDERSMRRRSMGMLGQTGSWANVDDDEEYEEAPAVRTLFSTADDTHANAPGMANAQSALGRSRSFLDAYRSSEARPWLDEDEDEAPIRGPAPSALRTTLAEVEDEDAPAAPRLRTALSAGGEVPSSAAPVQTDGSVPIAAATAAALAKLTKEEAPTKKKKKSTSEVVVNENGEVVKKKKKKDKEKDGKTKEKDPARRKKRASTRVKDEAGEPIAQPAEEWMDEGAPTTYLDSVRAAPPPEQGTEMLSVPLAEPGAALAPPIGAPLEPPLMPLEPPAPVVAEPVPPPMPTIVSPSVQAARAPPMAPVQPSPIVPVQASPAPAVPRTSPGRLVPLAEPVESQAAPIAEQWRRRERDPDAMSIMSVSTYRAPTIDARREAQMDEYTANETSRMHVFNHNASRLVINMFILYRGAFVMLRQLWRWERPWVTGSVASFYLVVWWRGDLLAIFFLLTFLYIATFRWLHLPAEETLIPDENEPSVSRAPGLKRTLSNKSMMKRTHRLDLAATQPLTVASSALFQQVGDQVLVYTHSFADVHERMKNLAMWRNPIATLRYLGWLLLMVLLSAHVTTWMMVKLPGALVFLCVFIVAPMLEYGYWTKFWDMLNDLPSTRSEPTGAYVSSSRTVLDNVLAGVPTDEEYLQQKLSQTRWEVEREQRRRGEFVEIAPNRIVEEESAEMPSGRVRRRRETRTSKPSRRVLQRWQDASDDVVEPRQERRSSRMLRPQADTSGVFSDVSQPEMEQVREIEEVQQVPEMVSRRGYTPLETKRSSVVQPVQQPIQQVQQPVQPIQPLQQPMQVQQPMQPAMLPAQVAQPQQLPLQPQGPFQAPFQQSSMYQPQQAYQPPAPQYQPQVNPFLTQQEPVPTQAPAPQPDTSRSVPSHAFSGGAPLQPSAPVQSTPLVPSEPFAQDTAPAPQHDPTWHAEVESITSEYDMDDDEEDEESEPEQRTVAERALSALGFGLPQQEPKPKAPEPQPEPQPELLPAWEAKPPGLNVAPAPPLFQVPLNESSNELTPEAHVRETPVSAPVPPVAVAPQPELVPAPVPAPAPAPAPIEREPVPSPHAAPAPVPAVTTPVPAAAPAPSGPPSFIAATSDTLQEQLDRRRRAKQVQQDTLSHATVPRQPSYASLSLSQDGVAMSPAVSVEAVHSRQLRPDMTSPRGSPQRIRWVDEQDGQGSTYLLLTQSILLCTASVWAT